MRFQFLTHKYELWKSTWFCLRLLLTDWKNPQRIFRSVSLACVHMPENYLNPSKKQIEPLMKMKLVLKVTYQPALHHVPKILYLW